MKKKLMTGLIVCAVFLVVVSNVYAKTYKMIMSNEVAVTHWKTGLMKNLGKMIEERSKGKISVKVFPGGQLFNDKEALKSLGTGAVQMVWPVSVNVETIRQSFGIVNLPFAVDDKLILAKPEFRQGILETLSKLLGQEGIMVMGLLRADETVFVFKEARPKKPEEMKGLKVRVVGGQVLLDWVGEFEVTPISMPASEFTTALSQGLIDGIHTSSAGWAKMIGRLGKFGLIVPNLWVATYSILLDQQWFDALPPDLQEVVVKSVDDIASQQWEFSIQKTEEAYKKIRSDFKSEVYRVPDAEVPRWAEKVRPAYKRFSDKFPDAYSQYVELNKKYGRQWPPEF